MIAVINHLLVQLQRGHDLNLTTEFFGQKFADLFFQFPGLGYVGLFIAHRGDYKHFSGVPQLVIERHAGNIVEAVFSPARTYGCLTHRDEVDR